MAYFIKLTGQQIGEPVFVNVDLVTHYHRGNGKGTLIYFGDSASIAVTETPEQVHAELKSEHSAY